VSRLRLHPRTVRFGALLVAALTLTACQQRMADQPRHDTLQYSSFYADGRSARPLEEGVFHRAQRLDSDPLVTGLAAEGTAAPAVPGVDPKAAKGNAPAGRVATANELTNFVDRFPFAMTAADLKRGKERYTIYCTPCHGVLGNGRGKIVERGFLEPTSFHTIPVDDEEVAWRKANPNPGMAELGFSRGFAFYKGPRGVKMSDVPIGYIYEVISRGYGGMPDYASQIPPADRWRIAGYVRALQLSQGANVQAANGGKK
jgi:mono/diheme cytochrome c family protein